MKLLEQDKDYNCSAFALYFLLEITDRNSAYKLSPNRIENELPCTEENGASHTDIKSLLNSYDIEYTDGYNTELTDLPTPCIVNYQYCDEDGCGGHYGVIINRTPEVVILYNPAIGEIEIISNFDFDKGWYSERYGNKWFLHIQ